MIISAGRRSIRLLISIFAFFKAGYADNTRLTDATLAIQRAFDDHPGGNIIIYFPNGLYLVSIALCRANASDGIQKQKRNILPGQSRNNGSINLATKNSTGYNLPNGVFFIL